MKYIPMKVIERRAAKVLKDTETLRIPVPVELVGHRLGIRVEPVSLNEISGVLVVRDDAATIGVNREHASVRQRFTIAHELGHYILHRDSSELFIDKTYKAVYRDERTGKGEERAEIQANQFAAALLMPIESVLETVKKEGFDLADEEGLQRLAEKFQVSQEAMTYRLSNMGIFPPP